MEKIEPRNYRGTCDWLGEEALLRRRVMSTFRKVFERFGFEPLETPEIELAEILAGKYGTEGDELSYYFEKGDDQIGLRYDHTVPLARVIAQYQKELVFPYKRYAMGPVFRADKPQAGRYRRFIQCDFDIVGVKSSLADAEVVAATYNSLKELGFKDFEVQICDRQLLNGIAKAAGATDDKTALTFMRAWDKLDKADQGQIVEYLREEEISMDLINSFLKITDKLLNLEKGKTIEGLRSLFPNQPLVEKGIEKLEQIIKYLKDFNVPFQFYRVNPCLARGLDYYTGPIFETVIKKANIGSISGGGRFDNLIETLGGPSIPATGSSFGLERIVSVMKTLDIVKEERGKTKVFVAIFNQKSPEIVSKSIEIASTLRSKGIETEVSMKKGSIGKQLKVADRRGVPIAVFVGPEELKNKQVTVKDLTVPFEGEEKDKWVNQWRIPEGELIGKIKEILD